MLYDKLIKEIINVKRAIKEKFGDDGQNKRGSRDYSSGPWGFDRIQYELGRIAEAIRHTASSGGGGIPDAPKDGKAYSRKNGGWSETPKTSEFADPNTTALRDDDGCINVVEGVEEGHAVNYGQMKEELARAKVSYSTSEVDTGIKWLDGKPIYQKTVVCPLLSLTTYSTDFPHGITTAETFTRIEGFLIRNTPRNTRTANWSGIDPATGQPDSSGNVNYHASGNNITVRVANLAGWTEYNAYITLQYTKV
jgi:hypothetical protein